MDGKSSESDLVSEVRSLSPVSGDSSTVKRKGQRLNTLSGMKSLLVYLAALSLVLLTTACSAAVKHDERTPAVARALQAPAEPQSAKHIILFIGDGMQLENEIATSRYLFGQDTALSYHCLPYRGNVATWDVTTYNHWARERGLPAYDPAMIEPKNGYDPDKGGSEPYPLETKEIDQQYLTSAATDSASAATAWATGWKTDSGNIAWLPDDPAEGALRTIAEILRDRLGYAIGVVSTVPFSHATPAAHVSHNVSRDNYYEIAAEILEKVKPEVVIGGGHPKWHKRNYHYLSETTYSTVKADPAYVVVERTPGVDGSAAILAAACHAAKQGRKLFGLFGGPGGNFEPPVPHDDPGDPKIDRGSIENPSLKDATLAALEVLATDPEGFFVMIEQGDIDWANHANEFSSMIGATWDLHEAVETAIDWVNREGDDIDWRNTLLIVTADHGSGYMRLTRRLGSGHLPTQQDGCGLGGAPCYPDGDVSYGTRKHTNELVRLYAIGQGAELFRQYEADWYPCTRILDNTRIFHVLAASAGVPQGAPLRAVVDRPARCPPEDSSWRPAHEVSGLRGCAASLSCAALREGEVVGAENVDQRGGSRRGCSRRS